MGDLSNSRKLQMVLHYSCQDETGLREASRVAMGLGMTISGLGAATLSARMSDTAFDKLFASASKESQLAVPEVLKPFVLSISEAPDHLAF
jgi:hypothetical protein